ncbi:MAG: DUF2344 domain-containing protein, partial [Candidatus Aminicenantes bacterium]
GFHPKMLISYPAALPLGMSGKAECFEFRSRFLFEEEEFVPRMNTCLPPGVHVLSLEKREGSQPTLNEEIEAFIYSVDLKSREIMDAVGWQNQKNLSSPEYYRTIEERIKGFLDKSQNEFIQETIVDRKKGKFIFHLNHSSQKSISAKEIVKGIFRIEKPAPLMAREEIVFKKA